MIDFILFMLLAFLFPTLMLYLWSKESHDTPPDHEKDIEIFKDYNYRGDQRD